MCFEGESSETLNMISRFPQFIKNNAIASCGRMQSILAPKMIWDILIVFQGWQFNNILIVGVEEWSVRQMITRSTRAKVWKRSSHEDERVIAFQAVFRIL